MEQLGSVAPDWRGLSALEREREVSPSSCIGGDYRPFIEAYLQRSEEARLQAEALGGCWIDGAWGRRASQRLALCLPPSGDGRGAGLMVYIHGGYWQELSAAQSLFAAAACVRRGIGFAAPDYTLAPAARVDEIVDECRQALAWLRAQAPALGLDAARIVVAGSSAGAHLAAMLALERDAAAPPLHGAVLVSGVFELAPLVGTSVNDALGLDESEARALSPALRSLSGFPPAVVCWGENETAWFKRQDRDYAAALLSAGTRCESFEVPGRNHFDVVLDLALEGSALNRAAFALFED